MAMEMARRARKLLRGFAPSPIGRRSGANNSGADNENNLCAFNPSP